jgi:hypothetical protein
MVIGSKENHDRQTGSFQLLEYLEAVNLGHLYIKENKVRLQRAYSVNGLPPVRAFANYIHVRIRFQIAADAPPCEHHVINN